MSYIGMDLDSSINMLKSISDYLDGKIISEEGEATDFMELFNTVYHVDQAIEELNRFEKRKGEKQNG